MTVIWKNHFREEATWQVEEVMRAKYRTYLIHEVMPSSKFVWNLGVKLS